METATIALIGDVMLGRGVAREIRRGARAELWGDTVPVLGRADAVVGNLECAVTDGGAPWDRSPKMFHFRAPPEAVEVLTLGGLRAVSLANNHILDYQEEGLLDTLTHLDRAGIARAGAGRNLEEALLPALFPAGGVKVGMLAFTDNEPGWVGGPDRPGTAFLDFRSPDPALRAVEKGVARAREMGAEVVLLSLHWGPNMRLRPLPAHRRFARGLAETGVDLVHGHSAHVFQGIEVIGRTLVLYDTGDFLDDYAVDPELRNDRSFLFLARVGRGGVTSVEMIPVRLEFAEVNVAEGEDFRSSCRRMRELSRELGTALEASERGLQLELPPFES
jgi:poly-gamma-glutamate capsule biosynthesis protein CapA/YwtB (metallophosphatase superfamily)